MNYQTIISPSNRRIIRKILWANIILLLAISILDIVGWICDIPFLRNFGIQWTAMKPATAICFLFSVAGLIIFQIVPGRKSLNIIPIVAGIMMSLVSILTLINYYWEYNYEEPIFKMGFPVTDLLFSPDWQMAFITAFNFFCFGIIFILLGGYTRRKETIAYVLIIPPIILSYYILLSYILGVYHAQDLLAIPAALNTGIAFCLLWCALLIIRPASWLMKIFISSNAGSQMARKLLPGLLLLPIVIGSIRIYGENIGWYSSEVGVGLVALTYTICFLLLVWIIAGSINRKDMDRLRYEALLSEAQQIAKIGSWEWNTKTREVIWSDHLYHLIGEKKGQIKPSLKILIQYVHPQDREFVENQVRECISKKVSSKFEFRLIPRSAPMRYIKANLEVYRDQNENVNRFIGTAMDITELKQAEKALNRTHADLEKLVHIRTDELQRANLDLKKEINIRMQHENALKIAEQKYRTVADFNYDWETWVSPAGKFIYVSPSCETITGYRAEEFIQNPALLFKISHPDDLERVEKHFEIALKEIKYNCSEDFRIITREGEERWIGHSCRPVYDEKGTWIGQRGSNRDITEQKKSESVLVESQKQLRALTHRLEAIAEEERIRIAREIHDELGHLLTALKFDIGNLISQPDLSNESLNELEAITSMVDALIDSVQRIATELRPGILDHLGLFPAIEWQIRQFQMRTKIICEYEPVVMDETFDNNETTIIFRILQEILTNAARHSKASKLSILINKTDHQFKLNVSDNGIGFDVTKTINDGALGLLGMRERAFSIGGEIWIESNNRKGTSITLILKRN